MAYVDTLYEKYYLEFASYSIKNRAIPNIDDGFKPVQRRILHALYEMHDGKYHKVANVVGQTMRYHPHGDLSIFGALVNLANKELFIDRQGNFGNIDGDNAAATTAARMNPSSGPESSVAMNVGKTSSPRANPRPS